MNNLIGFMLEKSIVNSAPIFLAALIAAYIMGPFFKNSGIGVYWRTAIYSVVGVGGGLWAYSAYDIPDRSIEVMEAITLGIAMFIYAAVIVGAFVLFRNRKIIRNGEGK